MSLHSASAIVQIRRATAADIELLVPLFDAYRQFYRRPSDPAAARRFLLERVDMHQSAIFLAFSGGVAIGFTQLFPSFSSVGMARIFILNDLFVAPQARRRGIGSALLQAAAEYARSEAAIWLVLSTELTNTTAQSLYEKEGWKRDTLFCSYQLPLGSD
jgi:GNAT superfamily N-acetyltransferase